jgi:hypothetical protein
MERVFKAHVLIVIKIEKFVVYYKECYVKICFSARTALAMTHVCKL